MERWQVPDRLQRLQERVVIVPVCRDVARSDDWASPHCISVVVGIGAVAFVEDDEEGCFLCLEDVAVEDAGNEAFQIVVSSRYWAAVRVVTVVWGEPHEVRSRSSTS